MTRAATPAVAVVVLNYNGLDDTLACLESLKRITYPAFSVILVDNGSAIDPEAAARARYPGLLVIKNGANLGYAGGNNAGMRMALDRGAEFVLVLNNDTTVAPSIISDLLQAFATDPRLGIVGPVINFMDEPTVVMTDGVRFNPGPGVEFFQRLKVPLTDSMTPTTVDIVNGCCMMIEADLLRRIGLFDARLFIVHEESDLCLRAKASGFRCAVLGRTLVWHKGSSSFDRTGRQVQRYFDTRNLYYLLRRHSGSVGESRPFRTSLLHYLRYAAYRYELELEAGKPAAANAVADGLRDALTGRTGPYVPAPGLASTLVRMALSAAATASSLLPRLASR